MLFNGNKNKEATTTEKQTNKKESFIQPPPCVLLQRQSDRACKLMKLALSGRTWRTPRGMHCLQTIWPAVHYLPYQRIHARFQILTPVWILDDELKLTTRRLMMLTLTTFIANNYKWVKISFPRNLARGITLRTQSLTLRSWKEPSVMKLRRTVAT